MLNAKTIASAAIIIAIAASAPASAGDTSAGERDAKKETASEEATQVLLTRPAKSTRPAVKVSRLRATEPVGEQALIIRTYLACGENEHGFEICDTITIACDDEDPGFCTSN